MLRRVMIAGAALLSALALSAGPANAGVGDLELFSQTGLTGTQHNVAEANIPSSCTAVPISGGEVRSAWNRTNFKVAGFYTNLTNCTNDSPLAVLNPGSSLGNLGGVATHYKYIPGIWLFQSTGFGGNKYFLLESALTTNCTAVDTSAIPSAQSAASTTIIKNVTFYSSSANCTNNVALSTGEVTAGSANGNLGGTATHFKVTN